MRLSMKIHKASQQEIYLLYIAENLTEYINTYTQPVQLHDTYIANMIYHQGSEKICF